MSFYSRKYVFNTHYYTIRCDIRHLLKKFNIQLIYHIWLQHEGVNDFEMKLVIKITKV